MTEENKQQIILDRIRHEDNLRDQRLNWLLLFQGFLFAALAQVWSQPNNNNLIFVLTFIGVFSSLSVWIGSICNGIAIQIIKSPFSNTIGTNDIIGYIIYNFNKNCNIKKFFKFDLKYLLRVLLRAFYPWNALPLLLLTAWIRIGFIFNFLSCLDTVC